MTDQNSAGFFMDRGDWNMNEDDYGKAIEDFTRAIELNHPDLYIAYGSRAEARCKNGDFEGALADANEASQLQPDYVPAYFTRCTVYEQTGEPVRAFAEYVRGLELECPHDPHVVLDFCAKYQHVRSNYDEAMAYASQAIALKPDYSPPYFTRTMIYLQRGDYDDAIADCTHSIDLNAVGLEVHYSVRGDAKLSKRDIDDAIADYEAALRINPLYDLTVKKLEQARQRKT